MTEFPTAIGACIDALYLLRAQRLAAQNAVDITKVLENFHGSY